LARAHSVSPHECVGTPPDRRRQSMRLPKEPSTYFAIFAPVLRQSFSGSGGFQRSPADSPCSPTAASRQRQPPANGRNPAAETEGEGFEPSSEENPLKRFSSPPHTHQEPHSHGLFGQSPVGLGKELGNAERLLPGEVDVEKSRRLRLAAGKEVTVTVQRRGDRLVPHVGR
jgi:hypothetical protein